MLRSQGGTGTRTQSTGKCVICTHKDIFEFLRTLKIPSAYTMMENKAVHMYRVAPEFTVSAHNGMVEMPCIKHLFIVPMEDKIVVELQVELSLIGKTGKLNRKEFSSFEDFKKELTEVIRNMGS